MATTPSKRLSDEIGAADVFKEQRFRIVAGLMPTGHGGGPLFDLRRVLLGYFNDVDTSKEPSGCRRCRIGSFRSLPPGVEGRLRSLDVHRHTNSHAFKPRLCYAARTGGHRC